MGAKPDDGDDAEITDINVTPLVDVTLVLLVIFMVTASLVFTRALPINLPKASRSEAVTQTTWQVVVTRSGALMLNGKSISPSALAAKMQAEIRTNPSIKVDLAADEGLSYGRVVGVLDLLKSRGVRHVVLSVDPR